MASCDACRAALATKGMDRARHVDSAFPDACDCERFVTSECSPSPVGPDEYLLRIVIDPCHVTDKDGAPRPKSTIFSESATIGASCLREEHATPEHVIRTVELLLERKPRDDLGRARGVFGVVRFPARLARDVVEVIMPDPQAGTPERRERRFCVYDTAEPGRESHADVMFTKHRQPSSSREQKFTSRLYLASREGFIPVDDFMDGLLVPYSAANREKALSAARARS